MYKYIYKNVQSFIHLLNLQISVFVYVNEFIFN